MNKDFDEIINREMTDTQIIKRLLTYVKPYLRPVIISFILVVIIVGLDLVGPYFVSIVLDELSLSDINGLKIILIVIAYLLTLSLLAFLTYKQQIMLQVTGQKIIYNIRRDVFNHMETLSISQFNRVPIGKLVTRVTTDIDRLNMLYTDVVVSVFKDILMVFGVFIFMSFLAPKLTLWLLGLVPLIFIASYVFRKFARKAYRKVRKNVSNINAFLSEHLSGMKLIQIFNREDKKYNEFKGKNNILRRAYYQEILTFSLYRPFMYMLYVLGLILILWQGTGFVIEGYISAGILFAFTQYVNRFFQPIQNLAAQFNVLQEAFTSGERIFEILDTVPEVQDENDVIELEKVKGKIEFKNVWFAYNEGEWVLKDVSFVVQPNQTMALVGATGSGKTTIISLVVRNYDIQKGQILIDDIDIKKIKISSLREKIGQMLQDVFLFSGTIESNIRLRDETITDRDVLSASKYVNADYFIQKLPDKYDELVRERGNNFSSGQRQLLSFARTIVHHPQIMILDEATANIDTETEMLIQESLKKIMNIGTMIIVAHRLSTIQHADNIIVMQKGKIIEQGNHQELLKAKGHYYQLYRLQYDKKVEE
ncbi:ABC transporter ATP-binding protein [Hujiaoplasma nucleasis]|uniref:ABC transporter ATP-binding protein n=2 Tax=Hujiaoplasma nucleasis TaxID=2725268 RepID=A0A7L6N7I2_9MOLU|nr:ABC transporter ATP-binding protein [Hujiaoplasma nucleasis]